MTLSLFSKTVTKKSHGARILKSKEVTVVTFRFLSGWPVILTW